MVKKMKSQAIGKDVDWVWGREVAGGGQGQMCTISIKNIPPPLKFTQSTGVSHLWAAADSAVVEGEVSLL